MWARDAPADCADLRRYPRKSAKSAGKGSFSHIKEFSYFDPNSKTMGGFHKQRLIILILCILGVISVFLPWIKVIGNDGRNSFVSGVRTPGFQSWGALLSLGGAIAILFSGDKTMALHGLMKWLAIGLCGLAALFGTYKVLDTIGFGLILTQIASLGGLFAAIYIGDKEKDVSRTTQPPVPPV